MQKNWGFKTGCLTIASGIIIGAAGGHKPWPVEQKLIFDRGLMFHFLNGIGMIISSVQGVSVLPFSLFGTGVLLFCGPLYHKSFTGKKTLSNYLPPFGGFAMIFGWLLLALKK
ncbi:unnamed protein product [Paramecium octaurelia]|uniref:DUF423 domain-containing protein n=1 Tax=Paramecium octaurelia TaxID=43137 RepID=A0A8S1XRQ4_PAROT|nr:unnamed protein product [Paramecium octaurelia]